MSEIQTQVRTRVIRPPSRLEFIDVGELLRYRDLLYFLVRRDIKVLYAQTVLGLSWAILNPTIQILIFTIIFGNVAKISTDGVPYILFSTVAVIPWTYMSDAMNKASQSLVTNQNMLGKIYFPRIIFPLTPVIAKILDFMISLVIVVGVMVYYDVEPTWNLLALPVFIVMMIILPFGIGLWLSALAIRFRDVKFAMTFALKLLIYTAPVLYPATAVPEQYQFWYALNPLVSVIQGFRVCLLGDPWDLSLILPGMVTGTILVLAGLIYFKRMERVFVDVI
ncbi:MAG: ABC transporter permease [Pseudomonadota bacterium]